MLNELLGEDGPPQSPATRKALEAGTKAGLKKRPMARSASLLTSAVTGLWEPNGLLLWGVIEPRCVPAGKPSPTPQRKLSTAPRTPQIFLGSCRAVSHICPPTGLLPCLSSPASSCLCPQGHCRLRFPEPLPFPYPGRSGFWAETEGRASSPTRDTLCHVFPTQRCVGASLYRLWKAKCHIFRNLVNSPNRAIIKN